MKTLGALNAQSLAIFLISGGGSAAVEKPADSEITLPDLVATYKALVNSGAPIAQINAIRKHLSAVKGGRMALATNGRSRFPLWFQTCRRTLWIRFPPGQPCPMPAPWTIVTALRMSTTCCRIFLRRCASCLNGARWMKPPSRMTRHLSAHAGGRSYRMRQRKNGSRSGGKAWLRRGD